MSKPFPQVENLEMEALTLARIVARTSWLPNPEVIRRLNRAVFPSIRNVGKRATAILDGNNEAIGMYDDNTTPQWALCWSHGLEGTRPPGWSVAHIWSASDDMDAYTHIANLALITESLASLTDKKGPLTQYLRWHAWHIYGWKPEDKTTPVKPKYYDQLEWRYLDYVGDPISLIRQRVEKRRDQRLKLLVTIMQKKGML